MEVKHSFLVGLTSILALVILAGLLMVFGEFDRLLFPSYAIEVETDHAAGLRPGSSVAINGMRIGQVDRIELAAGAEYPIRVVALIEAERLIPADAGFEIEQPLLGGSSVLSLIGDLSTDRYLPVDGTGRIAGPYRSMLDRLNDAVTERFEPLFDAVGSFSDLAGSLESMAADVRELTVTQDPAALQAGAAPNLRTAVARLNALIERTGETMALADRWLGDEELRAEAHTAVQRVATLFDEVSDTAQRYSKLADSLEADADRLMTEVRPVLDSVSLTLEQIRRVATTATDGGGTVAQLLNNPDLYRSLEDAAVRLERVLAELQLLIQKIKSEGLPIDL